MRNEIAKVPEKSEIKKAVSLYCKDKAISLPDFSVQSGVKLEYLGHLHNERWNEVPASVYIQLHNFCNRNKVENLYQTTDFVSTFKICEKARRHHFMIGLTADTGMGKTTAISAYSRQRNVFYICYDKSMNPRQFFVALLRELSYPFESNLNDMINRAANELNRLESPLLIIDESGKLSHKMILYIHALRDKIKGNCGVILAGMPYFKTNLQRMATKEKEGYAEFYRRVNLWHSFIGLLPKEIVEICRINGITDPERIKELKRKRRFGDLMNEIYLEQIMNEEL